MARKTRRNKRHIKIDVDATRILRSVGSEEAFHFYAGLGQPTEDRAVSLMDLLQKTKTVKLESLAFHLRRKDFQNWLEKTVGDLELARKVGRIRVSETDRIREEIGVVIENRVKELKHASTPETMPVDESLVVASVV